MPVVVVVVAWKLYESGSAGAWEKASTPHENGLNLGAASHGCH